MKRGYRNSIKFLDENNYLYEMPALAQARAVVYQSQASEVSERLSQLSVNAIAALCPSSADEIDFSQSSQDRFKIVWFRESLLKYFSLILNSKVKMSPKVKMMTVQLSLTNQARNRKQNVDVKQKTRHLGNHF